MKNLMSCGFKKLRWRDMRLRSQVLIILVMKSILVFTFIFGMQCVHLQMTQEIFLSQTKRVMIKQMQNKLSTQMWANQRSTTYIINRNAFQILGMNRLFNYTRNLVEIVQPPDFLLNFEQMDDYAYKCAYTYSFFGKSPADNDVRDSVLKNFTSLATEIFFLQDRFTIFFASIGEDSFFALNQGYEMTGYDPQIRPWYLNQIEHKDDIDNSPPYRIWGKSVYGLAQTTNLIYFDGSLEGVIAAEYNFTQFMGDLIDPSVQRIILGQEGLIYMINEESQIGEYIYNQSVTGYSYLDFVKIMQSIHPPNNVNQCTYNMDLLCLFNQNSGVENIVQIKQMPRSELIIMLSLDPSKEFQIIDQIINVIVEDISQLSIGNIQVLLGARLITTIISIALFFVISKPIYELVAFTKSFHHDQQSLKSQIKLYKQLTRRSQLDPIQGIKQSYFQLFNNLTLNQKCKACLEIESIPICSYQDISNYIFQNRISQIRIEVRYLVGDDYIDE